MKQKVKELSREKLVEYQKNKIVYSRPDAIVGGSISEESNDIKGV